MRLLAAQQAGFLRAMDAATDGPLALYRDSVAANQRHALAAAYPVVERLVGEAFFGEAARAHGDMHPSRSGDLHRHGDRFAEFLAGYPHAVGLPYLPDVARLEWAHHRAALAPDARGTLDAIATLDDEAWEHARLAWHPSCTLVRSLFAIEALWLANQPDRDGTLQGPLEAPCRLLVWRDAAHAVRVRSLAEHEHAFIAASLGDATLTSSVEAWQGEAAALRDLLATLATSGAILGVR